MLQNSLKSSLGEKPQNSSSQIFQDEVFQLYGFPNQLIQPRSSLRKTTQPGEAWTAPTEELIKHDRVREFQQHTRRDSSLDASVRIWNWLNGVEPPNMNNGLV